MELAMLFQIFFESLEFDSPFRAWQQPGLLLLLPRSQRQVHSYGPVLRDHRSVNEEFGSIKSDSPVLVTNPGIFS